ncbi:glycosyl transferase family 2 [Algoriphagus ratkowskyi]|uniref:Glycosyl transferase family 2 n=1 Tax=Algoriphagus ratkowskyi TaxID=57028 RepID=A0A2W7RGE3_9BACT|nr:glycosyltransferase [Algoriphagus ratkowskyi]PZX49795.1 glycosyl transferase family 2 [Algoriphagus ratkowskyi]TXD75485.1 glycosyltransferase [Algoriphagus ratkowskyi]
MHKGINLSIIIPNFNSGSLLDHTLASIFFKEIIFTFEVLIIDNLSIDNPRQYIDNYPEGSIVYISEQDIGIYDAMNKGVKLASGRWLFFLGAGDELIIDAVNQIKFNQYKNSTLIYANTQLLKNGKVYDGEFDLLKLMKRNISHQAIFYNLSVFNEIGYFDTNFKITADYIFNLKIFMRTTVEIHYLPIVVSRFLGGGLSDDLRDDFFQNNKLKIINKLVLSNFIWENLCALVSYDFYYLKNYLKLKIGQ